MKTETIKRQKGPGHWIQLLVKGARRWAGLLFKSPVGTIGFVILLLVILSSLLAGVLSPYDPAKMELMDKLLPPAWCEGGSMAHLLGTDSLGRDVLTRCLFGARISLLMGFGATAISALFGTVIGTTSAYLGGRVDSVITRILDTWMAVPALLVTLALIAGIGRGLTQTIVALAVGGIPGFARVLRAAALDVVHRDYMEAVNALGASRARAVFRHVVPNVMSQVLIQATSSVSGNILLAATLSFLGLGAQPPAPEWGYMLSEGLGDYQYYSYLVSIPGMAIAVTALAINILGDALRDALDPRLKK